MGKVEFQALPPRFPILSFKRIKTSLRGKLRSNSVISLRGFALINSIMSLCDVELHKTLKGHTSASSSQHIAPVKESS